MENNKIITGVVIVAGIVLGAFIVKPDTVIVKPVDVQVVNNERSADNFGASAGSDVMFPITFHDTARVKGMFTSGGGVLSTSTVSTAMVPIASTFNYGLIQVTPNTATLTYTLPASSTLSDIAPNAGDVRRVMVYNATTTSGILVTFAAGTGSSMFSTENGSALSVAPDCPAELIFTRKANSDLSILMIAPDPDSACGI